MPVVDGEVVADRPDKMQESGWDHRGSYVIGFLKNDSSLLLACG